MKDEEFIPEWFRQQHEKLINGTLHIERTRFDELLDEYEKKFNELPNTDPSSWSDDEWCEVLEECIKKSKTMDELLGIEYSDEWDD